MGRLWSPRPYSYARAHICFQIALALWGRQLPKKFACWGQLDLRVEARYRNRFVFFPCRFNRVPP
jgi:hypothetical protein